MEGTGTTAEGQSYRFRDSDLPFSVERVTYRLRQVDVDGTASLSDVITVRRPAVTELTLRAPYPNPVRTHATVQFAIPDGSPDERIFLLLYDVLGRQIRQIPLHRARGRNEVRLDVRGLASGLYFVRLTTGGETRTQRLAVVR